MNFVFFFLIWLALIIGQTTVMPLIPLFGNFYDLGIPLVIFAGLFRPIREGAIVTIAMGIMTDGLSGGPFGVYTTVYLWLYAVVVWLIGFLHVKNSILITFVVAAGVMFENMVLILTMMLDIGKAALPESTVEKMIIQTVWAIGTGPLILLALSRFRNACFRWIDARLEKSEA